MDISQWVGFIISVLALLYLIFRGGRSAVYQQKHPEEYAKMQFEEERRLKELLHNLDIDIEEEEEPVPRYLPPPPIRPPQRKQEFARRSVKAPKPVVLLHETQGHVTRVHKLLKRTQSPQDMILLREIIGPPKCVQSIRHHEYWG